jgi:hypothetical protein
MPERLRRLLQHTTVVQAAVAAQRPTAFAYMTVENVQSAQTYQNMTKDSPPGAELLSVERVIMQQRNISDVCPGNATGHAVPLGCEGHYHATPLVNGSESYYCYYRRRVGQAGLAPDCPGIETTARYHASILHQTGIDFVVPDTTNLATYPDPFSDLLNIRPTEVRGCN